MAITAIDQSLSIKKGPINTMAALAEKMEVKATKGLLGRHVAWLKKPRQGIAKVAVACLEALECAALALSVVGIYAIAKGVGISHHLDAYAKLKSDTSSATPPAIDKVTIKTKTETFNHINYYAISDGKLWFKPIDKPDAKWQLFYYDGLPKGRNAIEISADGANLAVLDNKRNVHYKKVLDEKRKNGQYSYKDITAKDNWVDRWFTLPVAEKLFHIFAKKRIRIPDDAQSWAISHRGLYNNYWEDTKKVKHPEFSMVTTLYVLRKNSRYIEYSDPWLPGKFTHKIECPKDPDFIPDKFSASGSTLFLRGTKTIKNADGTETKKTQYYTRIADWDTLGLNPFLKYLWGQKAPPEDWALQPDIPIEGPLASTSDNFTIMQTGEGNAARELRVEGIDSNGIQGYYHKMIDEKDPNAWKFVKTETG